MKNKIVEIILSSPIGFFSLHLQDQYLVRLKFLEKKTAPLDSLLTPAMQKIRSRLETYFEKPCDLTSLPFEVTGSAFQKRVWEQLCQIPLGQTITYGDLAKKLKTSARAIGGACRANPLPLVIPCHRVISKTNQGGYCGQVHGHFFKIKNWLLDHEIRK